MFVVYILDEAELDESGISVWRRYSTHYLLDHAIERAKCLGDPNVHVVEEPDPPPYEGD